MRPRGFIEYSRRRFVGSAGIVLIVVLVIALAIFIVQKTGVLSKKLKNPTAEGTMPWEEWEARQAMKEKGLPDMSVQQEFITKPLVLDVSLTYPEDNQSRGEIKLEIDRTGVTGLWSGSYHNERKRLVDIQSSGFDGKYYGDHTRDEEGNENPSKHYFFCKGDFRIMETGETSVKHRAGAIYVRGWIDEENMVIGRVFLTSNEKEFYEYHFKGKAREKKQDSIMVF